MDIEAWLADPQPLPAVRKVTQRLLAEADRHYERAQTGIADLPRNCRPAMMAARLVYAEIGREVERRGCDSVSSRAVVSGRRKLALLLRASLASAVAARAAGPLLMPPSVRFLVESVTDEQARSTPPQSFVERTVSYEAIKLGIDAHAKYCWVSRQVNGATPQPVQKMTCAEL